MEKRISKGQLQRLQVLYSQFARHTDQDARREARITWAQSLIMRPLSSFSDLTCEDARHLIDTLQGQMGIKTTRPRMSRDAAYRAGTEGRRGYGSNTTTMASAKDLERIQAAVARLDWSQAQFDAWLHASRSPLRHKATPQIQTLQDANKVWWALKGMLQARGLWEERR